MPRPVKWRKIEKIPDVMHFYPQVKDPDSAEENVLKLEEIEAVRLKDLEGLEQADCAERMEVSRPTFQRVLNSAREKIADSLVNGKAIRIEGGKYTRGIHPVRCLDCGRVWEDSAENTARCGEPDYLCPRCNSEHIQCGTDNQIDQQIQWRNCRRGGKGRGVSKGACPGRERNSGLFENTIKTEEN